ncbi:hypothetical protein [Nonomuraea turcica]|uniref:hypothetical protein n=1 Tax=Nonomuraea sp. G32 TaxID=3067274 RepID=UPI00273B795B|nr:hypothetical protein [Nonomuraea sp. G32]MDP4506851.1 hypothetical protein [Nonomuraea sp. G32]
MSADTALMIVTWAALIILYLGLAATLREVRRLRAEVLALRTGGGPSAAPALKLPTLAYDGQAERVVLAADLGCPACDQAVMELVALAPGLEQPPILLTYEEPEVWGTAAQALTVTKDPAAWSQIAHLTPPVVLLVRPDGRVADLRLPVNGSAVTTALADWGLTIAPERV